MALVLAALGFGPGLVHGHPFRVNEIPNGTINTCANCHVTPGGPRTLFGRQVEFYFLTVPGTAGHVLWGPLLASYDADGDGQTNGWELQDPWGLWMPGQPAPGAASLVTLPGDDSGNTLRTLTIHYENMSQHLGDELRVRVVDKVSGKETARAVVSAVPGPDFDVVLTEAIQDSGYYWVDTYADLSENGVYDPPPTDHAWRLVLENPVGDTALTLIHTPTFTDIDWVYELEVNLTGMTPHFNQALEIRVVDPDSAMEVGRARVDLVDQADFSVQIPGLRLNRTYDVDIWADLNRNGYYDPPPVDHAWRLNVTNPQGDAQVDFAHNTNFTDVNWGHLFTLHLHDMTPHLGDYFALRVVDGVDQEVGRVEFDSVRTADFSASAPGLMADTTGDTTAYRADFWADFNGNGMYDPPPDDHAWRMFFADTTGDVVLNFFHNTNFTDIQWPALGLGNWTGFLGPVTHLTAYGYPNPFNPATRIVYQLAQPAPVTLKIYNQQGGIVATLIDGVQDPGHHEFIWEAAGLPSGVYLYRVTAGGKSAGGKLVLLK
ncbi:MAG: T9SS C-terminal target domain-containing protein [Candidatus Zixiibacteriota bacterium]|nr:MAG: T9SS C-terminal target domain-containing protein [candidate division Zixibacteria bacterium]